LTFSAFYEIIDIEPVAKGAKMVDTGWKKEMDRLYEKTAKNWWKTGNTKKRRNGVTIAVNLSCAQEQRKQSRD